MRPKEQSEKITGSWQSVLQLQHVPQAAAWRQLEAENRSQAEVAAPAAGTDPIAGAIQVVTCTNNEDWQTGHNRQGQLRQIRGQSLRKGAEWGEGVAIDRQASRKSENLNQMKFWFQLLAVVLVLVSYAWVQHRRVRHAASNRRTLLLFSRDFAVCSSCLTTLNTHAHRERKQAQMMMERRASKMEKWKKREE